MKKKLEFEGIDLIDQAILRHLLEDSRRTYQEIADDIKVSPGTVHGRIGRMKDSGVITGSKITVDLGKLGFNVCAFIGVNLSSANGLMSTLQKLERMSQVLDVHYTTGQYSLFIKVQVKTTQDLHLFLINELQSISHIQSTETFISLDNPIKRSGLGVG